MKTKKCLSVLIAIGLFLPFFSKALINIPVAFLTVVKQTTGEEGNFHFFLRSLDGIIWDIEEEFDLQTNNGSASYQTYILAGFGPSKYWVQEQAVYGWNIKSVNCVSDSLENTFEYQSDSVIIQPRGDLSHIICTFTNIIEAKKTPVLIIPGVLGTEMFKGDEELWANPKMAIPGNSDDFMSPLAFNAELLPSDNSVFFKNVIGSRPFFNYTDGLIDLFKNEGYTENTDLFTFPYDWRFGVSGGNSAALKQKIDDILAQTGASKIDVIAHSTGGLLVKKYVSENPDSHHIGKAVFVGVPNTGAAKAVKVLLQGDNFGVFGLSDAEMKKISQNMPVVYDLAPSREYVNFKGSFYRLKDFDTSGFPGIPVPIPVIKNLDFNETQAHLKAEHGLNGLAMDVANNLHSQTFDNFDIRTKGVELYSIVGCKSGTLGQITESKTYFEDGMTFKDYDYDLDNKFSGDGTVLFESADSLQTDDSRKFYVIKPDHGKMLSQDGIRQKIVNLIAGSSLNVGGGIITKAELLQNPSQCQTKGKSIKIKSPLDIEVVDQSGNRLAVALDGSLQNDIPGADFSIMAGHKFVYLPDDPTNYSIALKGTDSGTFTLKVEDIEQGQSAGGQVFVDMPVSPTLLGSLNFISSQTLLNLDTNGDGQTDQTIQPSSVLDQNQFQDLFPPVSTFTIGGLMGQSGFYRSNVSVSLSAVDPVVEGQENQTSGLLNIQYNLDNVGHRNCVLSSSPSPPVQGGGNCIVEVFAEGRHTLKFYTTDKAGNSEPEKVISFAIDKTPPEFSLQFNPALKDLQFSGTDNISAASHIVVLDKDDIITAQDQAGNTAELTLAEKERKKKFKAEIKSLSYNGQKQDINKTALKFSWEYDKQAQLKSLEQKVKSKKEFSIEAKYHKEKTRILGKDKTGKIDTTLDGLIILKIFTNKADFGWGY